MIHPLPLCDYSELAHRAASGKTRKRAQKDEVIKKTAIKSQMVKNVKTGRREYTGMSATITEIWK